MRKYLLILLAICEGVFLLLCYEYKVVKIYILYHCETVPLVVAEEKQSVTFKTGMFRYGSKELNGFTHLTFENIPLLLSTSHFDSKSTRSAVVEFTVLSLKRKKKKKQNTKLEFLLGVQFLMYF